MTDATIFAADNAGNTDVDGTDLASASGSITRVSGAVRSVTAPRWLRALSGVANLGTYIGVTLLTVGLVMLLATWGSTAGTTEVAAQVPRLIIGGIGGIAVVVMGLTTISITARRADADLRMEQLADLRAALSDLNDAGPTSPVSGEEQS